MELRRRTAQDTAAADGTRAAPVPDFSTEGSISTSFAVPFAHRLLFTADALDRDYSAVLDLLEPSAGEPGSAPRVQIWMDDQLPHIEHRVRHFVERSAGRISVHGTFLCPGGESVKNDWRHVERVLDAINRAELDRRSYIIVIGGGAVLDAVGFAAATAHRGIRLIRLPTTTLAQADSGVGVKNAVNRFGKKNWLGTFAVPWAVVNDSALLQSLPDRAFRAGFSEAVKVTLLKSRADFEQLLRDAAAISRREHEPSLRAIKNSAAHHFNHITRGGDPFESLEARPLDFGHWSAHRMEALTAFELPHGEAVGIGVALDCIYSTLVHRFPEMECRMALETLRALGLPLFHPVLAREEELFAGLEEFRQHLGGRLTLTMLERIGIPLEVHSVDFEAMRQAIRKLAAGAGA